MLPLCYHTGQERGVIHVRYHFVITGQERGVKVELGDCRLYCAEGVAEADACGDIEMQAQFLMEAVVLDMMEGSPVKQTKLILKVRHFIPV